MVFQGSSSLPKFYWSLHIFPGDLLVTSSWLRMITASWHGFPSWSLPFFFHTASFPGTSSIQFLVCIQPLILHMRTYYVDFMTSYVPKDILLSLIILLKIEVHHPQPYDMTSQHRVLAYMYLILFLLSHPATILLEWRTSFPWLASSICHHVLIPKFYKDNEGSEIFETHNIQGMFFSAI